METENEILTDNADAPKDPIETGAAGAPEAAPILFDPALLPSADENGFVEHPDFARFITTADDGSRLLNGDELSAAGFEYVCDVGAKDEHGEDWQLISVREVMGDPVTVYVRRRPVVEAAASATLIDNGEPEPIAGNHKDRAIDKSTMLGDLIHACLDEIKAAPDAWPKMPQRQQEGVIYRLEARCRTLIKRVVDLVTSDERASIPASVESVTVKDGIKAVLTVSRNSPERHALVDAQGAAVLIVIADAEPYLGGDRPKSQSDQRSLLGDDDSAPLADRCPATAGAA